MAQNKQSGNESAKTRTPHISRKQFKAAPELADSQGRTLTAKPWSDKKNFKVKALEEGKTTSENKDKNFVSDSEMIPQPDASFLPGVKPVLELLQSQPERVDELYILKGRKDKHTDAIIDLCRENSIRFRLVDAATLSRVYSGKSQGVLARIFSAGFKDYDELLDSVMDKPLPLIVALDQVLDPGNAGTLARTLYALGGAGLLVTKHQGAYLGAGAARASAGALQRLAVSKVSNLAQALDKAEKQGFTIYGAASSESSESVFNFKPRFPAILVLGSEEDGIRQGVLKRCSTLLNIPMQNNFDSLNVAQAGAIILGFMSCAHQG